MISRYCLRATTTILAVFVLSLLPGQRVSASVLEISPSSSTLAQGQSETISVMFVASQAFTMTAADIEISFDTSVFSVSDVQLGTLDTGSGFSLNDNNNPGYISPLQASISTTSSGIAIANGQSGSLETFVLTALANAPVTGSPSDIIILANSGRTNTAVYDNETIPQQIALSPAPSNTFNGAIDGAVTIVPEPSSLFLMGVGCLLTLTPALRKKLRRAAYWA